MQAHPSPPPSVVRALIPSPSVTEWVHHCERCGARMEERQCKIICKNCGCFRDCSDP